MVRGRFRYIFLDASEIRRLYLDELTSYNDIAKLFGVSPPTVRAALIEAGVELRKGGNRKGKPLPQRRVVPEKELRRLYLDQKWPSTRLAQHFGCSKPTILERLRAFGIPVRHHNDTKRGAPSPLKKKLNASKVIAAYQTGNPSMAEIATKFKVSPSVIQRTLSENGVAIRSLSEVVRGKRVGERNPNWRPHLTDEDRARRRDSSKVDEWRLAVYARDDYRCQCCGDNRGRNLNAHHIVGYAAAPSLRWEVSNGITFCKACHVEFHRQYGIKSFGREDLAEFLANKASIAA